MENIKVTTCKYCGEEIKGGFCCSSCFDLFEDEPTDEEYETEDQEDEYEEYEDEE